MTPDDDDRTPPIDSPIDLPPEEFRRLGYRAVDLLTEHLAALPRQPCRSGVPDAVRRELLEAAFPEAPTAADALLDFISTKILPYPMGNGSPRFFGWVNSPAPLGVLAELLAAGLNPSVAGGDHAATYVELAVLRWISVGRRGSGSTWTRRTAGRRL